MAIKEGHKTVQITLPPHHKMKLGLMCSRLGLRKSEVIQRLIEQSEVIQSKTVQEEEEKKK